MLNLLRSALYLAWLTITVIPWAGLAVILSPVLPRTRLYWFCVGWLRLSIQAATWICGVKYRVQGLEHVPDARDGKAAVLLAPKHQSTWETFAMPAIMPHPLAYVFKRELLWIPFFGWAIGRLDMVHIDRSRRSEAWRRVQEQGQRLMAQGNWVIMFPEGTRTPRGSQGPYKTGATRLAIATGTPIVPIAVTSARCWPRKSFLLKPGTIDVSIGRPIPVEGRQADELMAEVEAWIESEMRRLDPEAYAHEAGKTDPAGVISATTGTTPSR
jgi:1-acyl-sn-glycerol-3-phosphate acyltransferase